jgi:hypothetical protein
VDLINSNNVRPAARRRPMGPRQSPCGSPPLALPRSRSPRSGAEAETSRRSSSSLVLPAAAARASRRFIPALAGAGAGDAHLLDGDADGKLLDAVAIVIRPLRLLQPGR